MRWRFSTTIVTYITALAGGLYILIALPFTILLTPLGLRSRLISDIRSGRFCRILTFIFEIIILLVVVVLVRAIISLTTTISLFYYFRVVTTPLASG